MGSSASFRQRGVSRRGNKGAGGQSSFLDVLLDGLGGQEVQAEGAALVAFLMGPQGGLLSVLVEIGHLEPAGGTQPYSGVKKRLQERAITEVEDGIAGGHGRRDQGIQVQAAFLAA